MRRLFFFLLLAGCGSNASDPIPADDAGVLDDTASHDDAALDVAEDALVDAAAEADAPPDVAPDAPPADPAVRFIGRFDTGDPAGPRFAWSASAVHARFSGTGVQVKLAGSPNQFAVSIDGKPPTLLKATGTSTYTLATGLAPGTHDVLLFRRTEAFFGESQFLGFTFTGGALLPPPPAPSRRIEVIGDSISAAYGIEGKDQHCSFTADTENAYIGYAALTARRLAADVHVIAWSGIGAYRNYDGKTTGTMPELWGRTLPARTTSTWAGWDPHVVVINLGTNDYAAGDPGTAFRDAYLAFARKVHKAYPKAQLVFATGPMLDGAKLTSARTHLDAVEKTLKDEGDANVGRIDFPTQLASDGFGCDWHPSAATNVKMANQLEARLKTLLGW